MAAAPDAEPGSASSGMLTGLGKAVGTMLGLHLQYAQREASDDVGRVIGGALTLLWAVLFLAAAVFAAHVALVFYLAAATSLELTGAVLAVGGGDLLISLILSRVALSRLRRPLLKQTRSLVKQTVDSLVQA